MTKYTTFVLNERRKSEFILRALLRDDFVPLTDDLNLFEEIVKKDLQKKELEPIRLLKKSDQKRELSVMLHQEDGLNEDNCAIPLNCKKKSSLSNFNILSGLTQCKSVLDAFKTTESSIISIYILKTLFVAALLMTPFTYLSLILGPFFRLLFGTLYPAYASYKAVRTKDVKKYVQWMMYWIVFALFTCIETFTDIFLSWFPFYYEIKIIIVIWLLSPATNGSSMLYRKIVHPVLTKRETEIDDYLNQAKEKGYSTVLQLGSKGVNYATSVIMQTAIKGLNNVGYKDLTNSAWASSDEPDTSASRSVERTTTAKKRSKYLYELDAEELANLTVNETRETSSQPRSLASTPESHYNLRTQRSISVDTGLQQRGERSESLSKRQHFASITEDELDVTAEEAQARADALDEDFSPKPKRRTARATAVTTSKTRTRKK